MSLGTSGQSWSTSRLAPGLVVAGSQGIPAGISPQVVDQADDDGQDLDHADQGQLISDTHLAVSHRRGAVLSGVGQPGVAGVVLLPDGGRVLDACLPAECRRRSPASHRTCWCNGSRLGELGPSHQSALPTD